jgi:rod shape-determining protein MreC
MLFIRSRFLGFRVMLLACLAVILIYAEHRQHLIRTRATLSFIASPLQYVVNWPIDMIHSIQSNFTRHFVLQANYQHLQEKQLLLEARLQRLESLEKENQQLRALLGSASQISGKVLVAQLLAVDLAPFTQQVLLNKGEKHGVYLGQPVLDASGVMGQVVAVSPLTSRVMLISDARSAVPTQNQRNGNRAIAAGTGLIDRLELLYVPGTTDYQVGDTLVTSGLGQRYPVGYPVGSITKVEHKVGERFTTVHLTPVAHLNSSRQVLLVWPDQAVSNTTNENSLLNPMNNIMTSAG